MTNLTGAPSFRAIDQLPASPIPAMLAAADTISEAVREADVLRVERDNALLELEKAHDEIARLTGLLAAWSDEKRSQGLKAADKARKRVGR